LFIEQLFKDPLAFSSTVLVVVFSVIFHELAHGWAALSQGDETPCESGHMTLDPLTHMGWTGIVFLLLFGLAWGSMPVNPARFKAGRLSGILVALAGPLSNLFLGALFIAAVFMMLFFKGPNGLTTLQENLAFVFQLGALLNVVLFLFNLIPIPPLDGYHIVSEIIPPLRAIGDNPQLPVIALIILYSIPGFWSGLYGLAGRIVGSGLTFLSSVWL
jgi:Zn-dependent protease